MTDNSLFPEDPTIAETIECTDLERSLVEIIEEEGFRLFSIFPADSPRTAIVERKGVFVKLEKTVENCMETEGSRPNGLIVSRFTVSGWNEGRAGMQYRDLIPGRLGGRLIASHIRIPDGGPVPDYVHFHKVDFQVIFCLKGWCELVYEDQGPPFRFEEGDCVLQPPGIRHRVLRCSDGFEVLELSSPAEHPTYAEHGFELPTESEDPERIFEGQRFVLARSRELPPVRIADGIESLPTGLAQASGGSVDVLQIRGFGPIADPLNLSDSGSTFVLVGEGFICLRTDGQEVELKVGDVLVSSKRAVELVSIGERTRFVVARF